MPTGKRICEALYGASRKTILLFLCAKLLLLRHRNEPRGASLLFWHADCSSIVQELDNTFVSPRHWAPLGPTGSQVHPVWTLTSCLFMIHCSTLFPCTFPVCFSNMSLLQIFTLLSWRWQQLVLSKRQYLFTKLHSVTLQQTIIFISVTMRTWHVTPQYYAYFFLNFMFFWPCKPCK